MCMKCHVLSPYPFWLKAEVTTRDSILVHNLVLQRLERILCCIHLFIARVLGQCLTVFSLEPFAWVSHHPSCVRAGQRTENSEVIILVDKTEQ